MRQTLGIVFGFLMAAGGAGFAQTVPSQYQDLYNSLNSNISTFDAAVRMNWDGSRSGVIYAPQLEAANSAVFTGMLGTTYYTSTVLPQLEALAALGAKGVKVQVDFPILYQNFYSSDPSLYTEFANFYQNLATGVHSLGMKLTVETMAENQFPGDSAGTFTEYYTSLTWTEYMAGRAAQAVAIAQLMQPDYLSLITEPDSEASYTGQTNAATLAGSTQLLQTMLTALQTAGITGVSYGAGTGSWLNNSSQYIQNFVALPIQYVDVHVYPLNEPYLMNTLTMASIAASAGKPVAISQLWDFKEQDSDFGVLSLTQVEALDPFSFWAPIDTAFLQAMSDYANYEQAVFISPFWSHYFSAYLDYGTYGSLPVGPLLMTSTAASAFAEQSGSYTPTGEAWLNLSIGTPDTTPPAMIATKPGAIGSYSDTAQLIWAPTSDNVGVAGYHVLRNGQVVGTTSLLEYTDANLTPGTTYQYTITAFDASGNTSLPSPALTYKTTTSTPPSMPTQLTVQSVTASGVALTWNVSTSPYGISSYDVYKGITATSLNPYAVSTTTSYTDTAIGPGVTFYYAVVAIDKLGDYSPITPSVTVTDPQEAAPSTPGAPIVYSDAYNQVVLYWPYSTSTYGISGYLIFRGTTPTSLTQIGNSVLPFYGDGTVTPSTTHYYAVTAYDLDGVFSTQSVASAAVAIPQEPAPTAPGNPAANALAYNQVALSWTASTSGSGLGGYTIYRGSSPTSLASIGSAAATATTFTDGSTQPLTTYYYAVAAYDTYGLYGPNSSTVSVTTPQEPPPTAPGNPAANAIAYNQVAVSWTASTSGSGVGGYTIYRGSSPSSLASIGSAPSAATTYTDNSAQPLTTYYYAVAAYDTYGLYGPKSSSVSVTTPQGPTLGIAKQHAGSFTQNQQGAQYTVTVSNAAGAAPTSGTVTVTEAVPSGETLVSMSGSGWNCSVIPTCTQSSPLAAGMAYGAITVTVNVAANASSPQVNSATVNGGNSASATANDSTTIIVEVPVPNVVGDTQAAATTAITGIGLVLGTVTTASSSTVASGNVISESPLAGTLVVTGSAVNLVVSTGPPTVAVPNVVGDTQAAATTAITGAGLAVGTVTMAYSATVASGNVISESPVAGTVVTAGSAVNLVVSEGPGTPAVGSVTPSPATGLSNTFALTYSDTAGYASLSRVGAIFNPATGVSNSCYVLYYPSVNLLYLLNNAGTGTTNITPGSGTLSNSQCTISGSGTTVAKSGNTITLNLAVTASSTYTGKQSIFMYADDVSAANTGWVDKGTWTPAPNQPPTVVSVTPNPATGLSNTFALTYSDPNGASDVAAVEVDFGPAVSATNSCFVVYLPATNSLELLTNAGAASAKITPGSGTLSNSQCTITGSGTTVARSGDTLTLNLAVTASSTYTGKQNIYMFAEDNSAATTGYVEEGTWTPAANQAPTVVSATPDPASGLSNTFALTYSDPNGASDLDVVEVDFGSAVSGSNSCFVLYYPATNSLELLTNTGAVSSKITPGSGTLSNSQCTISGSGTTVVRSGDTLTLNLAVTASSTYTSQQNVFLFAEDNSSAQSGWVKEGTWTP
jgi:fibronectin type 3 domain-containing protein